MININHPFPSSFILSSALLPFCIICFANFSSSSPPQFFGGSKAKNHGGCRSSRGVEVAGAEG